jgi:hypothetical protein
MNAHAKRKLAQIRGEKRVLEQNLEIHKKQLLTAKEGQFKTMLEKSIATDGERIECLGAMAAALAPLAGEAPPAPKPPA